MVVLARTARPRRPRPRARAPAKTSPGGLRPLPPGPRRAGRPLKFIARAVLDVAVRMFADGMGWSELVRKLHVEGNGHYSRNTMKRRVLKEVALAKSRMRTAGRPETVHGQNQPPGRGRNHR
jgi:hypothetical protein